MGKIKVKQTPQNNDKSLDTATSDTTTSDTATSDQDIVSFDFNDNNIEIEDDKILGDDSVKEEDNSPTKTDPGWTDYVLKALTEDEMFKGRPTVDGLRRLTELFIGEIISSESTVCQTPSESYNSCIVKVCISIQNSCNTISVDGLGHADNDNNTQDPFAKFNVTIAETRAEGRALKKILGLKKVLTVEESVNIEADMGTLETSNITNTQITTIDVIAKRLNIDINKLISTYYKSYNINKLENITHDQAIKLIKTLSEYQQESSNISKSIIGYKSNWRNNYAT